MRTILYFWRRAFASFGENPLLHVITIAVIAVSGFLFAGFLTILAYLDTAFEGIGKDIQVIAYLKSSVEPAARDDLAKRLRGRPEVEDILFVSKREALARMEKMLHGNRAILEELRTDNPLPESFRIRLRAKAPVATDVSGFASWLSTQAEVGDVVYGQEWLERFSAALEIFRLAGFLLGGLLIFAAAFLIANTIKVALYARRDELEILRLVGATPVFVACPFLIEGIVQGFLGSVTALLSLFLVHGVVVQNLQGLFTLPSVPFLSLAQMGLIIAGGMFLGALGALASVSKFMRT